MFLKTRFSDFLISRRLPVSLACLVTLLALPSLFGGLSTDDYAHSLVLRGLPGDLPSLGSGSRLELFSFLKNDPGIAREYMARGIIPWWTNEHIRLAFWRPIASLTHFADHKLFPDFPALMHAHSLAWAWLMVFAAARFFASVGRARPKSDSPGGTAAVSAGLAALIWAVDDARAMPVAWIANRNAVIAVAFGLISLRYHVRRRSGGCSRDLTWSLVAFAAALLSAEAALGALAYLVAWALFMDRAGRVRGLAAIAPHMALIVLWRLAYNWQGYGAAGGDMYRDPVREPLYFLAGLLDRAPVLLLAQWIGPPSEVHEFFSPPLRLAGRIAGWVFTLALVLALTPRLRASATARFWFAGMLLSLVPVCATAPMDRLLFFAGLGAAGLLAEVILQPKAEGGAPSHRGRLPRLAVGTMIVIHLVLAPLLWPLQCLSPVIADAFTEPARRIASDPEIDGREVILVNAPCHLLYSQMLTVYTAEPGVPRPARVRLLASGMQGVRVERTGERSLTLTPEVGWLRPGRLAGGDAPVDGGRMFHMMDRLFRSELTPFAPGDTVSLPGFTATILDASEQGLPDRVRFDFAAPLEDPRYYWRQWRNNGFGDFIPPAPGESVLLPRVTVVPVVGGRPLGAVAAEDEPPV